MLSFLLGILENTQPYLVRWASQKLLARFHLRDSKPSDPTLGRLIMAVGLQQNLTACQFYVYFFVCVVLKAIFIAYILFQINKIYRNACLNFIL